MSPTLAGRGTARKRAQLKLFNRRDFSLGGGSLDFADGRKTNPVQVARQGWNSP
jgi:hypothetical protein